MRISISTMLSSLFKTVRWPKLRSKRRLFLAGGALTVLLTAFFVGANVMLHTYRQAIQEAVSAHLPLDVHIAHIRFYFPKQITLSDVDVRLKDDSRSAALSVPQMDVTVSLIDALFRHKIGIQKIGMSGPDIHMETVTAFFKDNPDVWQNGGLIRSYLTKDFRLVLQDFDIHETQLPSQFQSGNANFLFAESHWSGFGFFPDAADPILFNFRMMLDGHEVRVEHCVLQTDKSILNIWGDWKDGDITLGGYAFLDSSLNLGPIHVPRHLQERLQGWAEKAEANPSWLAGDTGGGLSLWDINGRMKVDNNRLEIQQLAYTLNNAPISVTGNVMLQPDMHYDLTVDFRTSEDAIERGVMKKHAVTTIKGVVDGDRLAMDVNMHMDLWAPRSFQVSLEKMSLSARGVEIRLSEEVLRLGVDEGRAVFTTNGNPHAVSWNRMKGRLGVASGDVKPLYLASDVYEGHARADMSIDTRYFPFRIEGGGSLQSLDANQMSEVLEHFGKVHGRMSSRFTFHSHPHMQLDGKLLLDGGELHDYTFFSWLAHTFRLPELNQVRFHHADARYTITPGLAELDAIRLESDQVRISGYFAVNHRNLVSSELGLTLNRPLLKRSAKGKVMLKVIDPPTDDVRMDFQLSGILGRMNFRWVESDAKDKIQEWMPDYIEKIIERRIDQTISSAK